MPFIIALEDAGLSRSPNSQDIDAVVFSGQRLAIDWVQRQDNHNGLGQVRLAGNYTCPESRTVLSVGDLRFINSSRFDIPVSAWILGQSKETAPTGISTPRLATTASGESMIPPEVAIINHYYEGCRLEAYVDPRTGGLPITIGWGSTFYTDMSPVRMGDKITRQQADELYAYNCYHRFWKVLEAKVPYWREMTPKQQAALCSFAYNMGADFYGHPECSTITRNLRDRDWDAIPGALPMYRNPGENVEVGLGRRRRAEGLMWIGVEPLAACQQAEQEIHDSADCLRYEQQLKSISIRPNATPNPTATHGQEIVQITPVHDAKITNRLGIWLPNPGVTDFTIPVKHYTQCDNKGGRGYRECFKTSCTMLADYLTGGKLSSIKDQRGLPEPEDAYQSFMGGDTTLAEVHIAALKQIGIEAYFSQSASVRDVESSLDCGIPVPIGVKYKDGGHWLFVNGRGPKGWDVLCPYGLRDGATNAWVQIFQAEEDAKMDTFSTALLRRIFTDLGPEMGWALFVTAVNGIPTGVKVGL